MNKNIYCTLDTETVGGSSNPTGMYNQEEMFTNFLSGFLGILPIDKNPEM